MPGSLLLASHHRADVKVVAKASRDAAKAATIDAELGISQAFGTYEALLSAPHIDATNVPLPNTIHAEWAIKATDAGKRVLCEKPQAMSLAEAKSMFAAARRNGEHLVEAYPYLSQPTTLKAREEARGGSRAASAMSFFPAVLVTRGFGKQYRGAVRHTFSG